MIKTMISSVILSGMIVTSAMARDHIQIAGSSTVLPYATIVAELFNDNFDYPSPVVESGGSGAGQKKLCEGIGENTIDIANSSSIFEGESLDACKAKIGEVTEVRIGYDGITFSTSLSNEGFEDLTVDQIFNAVRADSPYVSWNEIDSSLPDVKILVFLPGTKHGTREVFEKKVMIEGCKIAGLYDSLGKEGCIKVRTDGASVDIDGDYTETLARLRTTPTAIGVFGLAFVYNNADTIYAARIDGVEASIETISTGDYPISRPLQFYVKNAHLGVIPGLREFIEFFVSDEIAGAGGPLSNYGLVPDPELDATQKLVSSMK